MVGSHSDARRRGSGEAFERAASVATARTMAQIEGRIPGLVAAMTSAGVEVIVLKGPVTRVRLYGADEVRSTGDIDLLVDPSHFRAASRVLRRLGYWRVDRHGHSDTFAGGHDDPKVDLHLTLPFVARRSTRAFTALRAHAVSLDVAGSSVPVLDEPAHVVHLAIHAAVNRFVAGGRTFTEWERGLASLDDHQRNVAQVVASQLGVTAVWDRALYALEGTRSREELVAGLPMLWVEPTVSSLRALRHSGIPAAVCGRYAYRMVHFQVSDEAVKAWRADRNVGPLLAGTWRSGVAKMYRLISVGAGQPLRGLVRSGRGATESW